MAQHVHISILVAHGSEELGHRLARVLANTWPTALTPRFTVGSHQRLSSQLIEESDALLIETARRILGKLFNAIDHPLFLKFEY